MMLVLQSGMPEQRSQEAGNKLAGVAKQRNVRYYINARRRSKSTLEATLGPSELAGVMCTKSQSRQ
jgi:hypothetical protein